MKMMKALALVALPLIAYLSPVSQAATLDFSGAIKTIDGDGDGKDDLSISHVGFTLTSAGSVTIDSSASGFDGYLWLFDSEGLCIAENNDKGMFEYDALISKDGLAAGEYTLAIGAAQATADEAWQGYDVNRTLESITHEQWGGAGAPGEWSVVLNGNCTVSPVPLPAGLPLFASAILGLFGLSRRR